MGANQNARKLLSTDLVNTNNNYYYYNCPKELILLLSRTRTTVMTWIRRAHLANSLKNLLFIYSFGFHECFVLMLHFKSNLTARRGKTSCSIISREVCHFHYILYFIGREETTFALMMINAL